MNVRPVGGDVRATAGFCSTGALVVEAARFVPRPRFAVATRVVLAAAGFVFLVDRVCFLAAAGFVFLVDRVCFFAAAGFAWLAAGRFFEALRFLAAGFVFLVTVRVLAAVRVLAVRDLAVRVLVAAGFVFLAAVRDLAVRALAAAGFVFLAAVRDLAVGFALRVDRVRFLTPTPARPERLRPALPVRDRGEPLDDFPLPFDRLTGTEGFEKYHPFAQR